MELKRITGIITSRLAYISAEVRLNGSLNLLDGHVLSEDLFCAVLNTIYGWNLQNANRAEQNFKAIDLVDSSSHIIVQVSSDNSKLKVQNSLAKIDTAKFTGYTFKFVSIAKGVSHLRKASFKLPKGISFDAANDSYDIDRIVRDALSKDIDTQIKLASYLEKAIFPASIEERRPSVITYVINCLSEENLSNIVVAPETKPFDVGPKIDINELKKWRPVVEEYAVYSVIVDKIYSQYDKMGVNKSYTVLLFLHSLYLDLSRVYSGDELFNKLESKVYEIVDGDRTCNECLTREELLINIRIVLVDAFVKCKIFKRP